MNDHPEDNISSPRASADAGSEGARRVPDRSDIVQAVEASDVELVRDPVRDDVVLARFWNGVHSAYGATARVTESPSAVTVHVRTGVLPEALGRPVVALAERHELQIVLSRPIGRRSLH